MSQSTTILQPTANELIEFIRLATSTNDMAVKFTIEVTPQTNEMLTMDVATRLNVSKRKVATLVADKILTPIKRGGKLIFSREQVNLAIKEGLI